MKPVEPVEPVGREGRETGKDVGGAGPVTDADSARAAGPPDAAGSTKAGGSSVGGVTRRHRERTTGGPGMIVAYLLLGVYFGVVLMKSEAASWFRIQEMFRFQSFHMYGILGSAVLVAAVSVRLIRWFDVRSYTRERIRLTPKTLGKGVRYGVGGTLFGLGWALTGACPGPLFALFGSGVGAMGVAVASAVLGTWTYGILRSRLPH